MVSSTEQWWNNVMVYDDYSDDNDGDNVEIS